MLYAFTVGNPSILNRPPPPAIPQGPPVDLRDRDLVWQVYLMREGGAKLMRHAMVPTRRTGRLTIRDVNGTTMAVLQAQGGDVVRRLADAKVRRLTPRGSMVVQGYEVAVAEAHWRQAWWCVMER